MQDGAAEGTQQQQQGEVLRAGWPGGPPLRPSFEGGDQRCFRRMYVCTRGMDAGDGLPVHQFGQHMVRYYRPYLPPLPPAPARGMAAAAEAEPEVDGQRGRPMGGGGGGAQQTKQQAQQQTKQQQQQRGEGEAAAAPPPGVIRIVFQHRGPGHPGRQILNLPELLERCNAWRYRGPKGRRLHAECVVVSAPCCVAAAAAAALCCRCLECLACAHTDVPPAHPPHSHSPAHAVQADFGSLASGIAAAQSADIVVGMHGANQANGWFLRPGSSMVRSVWAEGGGGGRGGVGCTAGWVGA